MSASVLRFASRGALAILSVLFLLVGFCQAHGFGREGAVPLGVSVDWAIGTLFWWAVAAAVLVLFRHPLLRLVESRRVQTRLAAVALAFVVTVTTAMVIATMECLLAGSAISFPNLTQRLLSIAPACALAAALLISVLHICHQRSVAAANPLVDGAAPWVPLPEEPQLLLRKSDVSLIRSAGNYCELHALGRLHLARVPLKNLSDRLTDDGFVQVHRSVAVNVAHVKLIGRAEGTKRLAVHLNSGEIVPVGRSFIQAVRQLKGAQAEEPRTEPLLNPRYPADRQRRLASAHIREARPAGSRESRKSSPAWRTLSPSRVRP